MIDVVITTQSVTKCIFLNFGTGPEEDGEISQT